MPATVVSCKPLTVKAPPPRPPCPTAAVPMPVLPDPTIVMQLLQAMEQDEALLRQNEDVTSGDVAQRSVDPLLEHCALTASQ